MSYLKLWVLFCIENLMYCNGQYETVVSEFRPVVTHVPPPHLPACISIYLRAGNPVQYPKDVCVFELYFIKYLNYFFGDRI